LRGKLDSELQIIKKKFIASIITALSTQVCHFKGMVGVFKVSVTKQKMTRHVLRGVSGGNVAAAVKRNLKGAIRRTCRAVYKERRSCYRLTTCERCAYICSTIGYLPSKSKVKEAFVMFVE